MPEIGTFEFSETGFAGITNRPAMRICTKHGWLVCCRVGDDGIYDEFEVDLVKDDGRVLQLSTTGVTEDYEFDDHSDVHVYAYDGMNEDVAHVQAVRVCEESMWW